MANVQAKNGWVKRWSETKELGPADARNFAAGHANLPTATSERELDPQRKKWLQEKIRAGLAVTFNWASVERDGKWSRMNGQHSSVAIRDYDGDLPDTMSFHLDHYEAFNREGVGKLFQQFDPRQSVRSKLDISGAYQGLAGDALVGLDRKNMKLAIEGVAYYRKSVAKGRLKSPRGDLLAGDDIYNLFFDDETHPFLRWFNTVITDGTPEMKFAPIAAAMFGTYGRSVDGADEFWLRVAKNNLTDGTDPVKILSDIYLQDRKQREQGGKKATEKEMYVKSIKAWNAFRAGQKIMEMEIDYTKEKGLPQIAE